MDGRPPIVFLRSFAQDDILRTENGLPAEKHPTQGGNLGELGLSIFVPGVFLLFYLRAFLRVLLGVFNLTLEEELERYFGKSGPFIALGKPGELLAPGGATRVYVEGAKWKPTVTDLVKRAQLVVWQGSTPGALWELALIRRAMDPRRVVLLIPNPRRFPEEYQRLVQLTAPILPKSLPWPEETEAQYVTFDSRWNPLLHPFHYFPWLVALFTPSPLALGRTFTPLASILRREPARRRRARTSDRVMAWMRRLRGGVLPAIDLALLAAMLVWIPLAAARLQVVNSWDYRYCTEVLTAFEPLSRQDSLRSAEDLRRALDLYRRSRPLWSTPRADCGTVADVPVLDLIPAVLRLRFDELLEHLDHQDDPAALHAQVEPLASLLEEFVSSFGTQEQKLRVGAILQRSALRSGGQSVQGRGLSTMCVP